MKILQAYRYQLRPTESQRRNMARFAGCRRFVYNRALALQKERYAKGQRRLGFGELCKELTSWKRQDDTSFLRSAPAQVLQQGLMDLDKAYKNHFAERASVPRFRKRGRRDGFRYPQPSQIKLDETNARIFLPKLGWMKYRKSRLISGAIRQVTVVGKNGKWFVNIQTERDVEKPMHPSNSMVGIDLGVARFATLSDGTVIEEHNNYRKSEKEIARQQRRLSRQQKNAQNWKKQNRRLRKKYEKQADRHRDFLHKASDAISKTHAVVIIEDLNVKGMSASASGTIDNPGTNVKAKSRLNKAIREQGWGEFRRQLEYKTRWRGGLLIVVPARNTSLSCSKCSYISRENRKSQARFECGQCGHTENADLNAARNILSAGRAVYACGGEPLGFSMKQEPSVSAIMIA
jgi:putative transposase